MKLTIEKANNYLIEASKKNDDEWVGHSYSVGMAAYLLAQRVPQLDAELAGSYGLLHDIGRGLCHKDMKIMHIFAGYRYLLAEGYTQAARICLTHSFPVRDIKSVTGVWDCSETDYVFLTKYLQDIEYNPYDKLIQLCDNLGMAEGIVPLEKRLVDIIRRYGLDAANVSDRWAALFAIKEDIEQQMGVSVEEVLGLNCVRPIERYFWRMR